MAARVLLQLTHPTVLNGRTHMPVQSKSLTSSLSSTRSEFKGLTFTAPASSAVSLKPVSPIQPVARRICRFTGKKANKANKVSFSNHNTKIEEVRASQYKKVWWEAGKRFLKLRLSSKALKTIEKNGLDAVAKNAGIYLSKK
uniref:Putative 50S ribosomal protein L28 n=1 Tax=Wolffia arrhiza TaxID=161111 RepID=G4WMU6_WOLAR|nr:putative 50S ribosomal protein L28 [Wolffia arrhiza]